MYAALLFTNSGTRLGLHVYFQKISETYILGIGILIAICILHNYHITSKFRKNPYYLQGTIIYTEDKKNINLNLVFIEKMSVMLVCLT